MPGLISINLGPKTRTMGNRQLVQFCEKIDEWLNENCEPETYFANRCMRFNFRNQEDALAFKLLFG